ncbi:NAD(P)H-dependent oxidoreductase [Paraflavitalea sp. CAU 1676]|uniref:NAD(P)H-dependent oxidoreductase n=1 Tax=Paraflavitalea sp. CAU 1676 TaxID=3032598 RepID=UPI0023DA0CEC|nr:NAD(P)H-dependent oxidoreductase [Paraflavitalea sp. CAU 1676]MDF2189161.1 NAD(P)H-dependent oxidoreductase [Paraflavitalea sp. CAU 1676]
MKVLIILAHPEPQSMNSALFNTAVETLRAAGHTVKTSNLYAMRFNPVSDSANFIQRENPAFFKQQLEELHATATQGFAPDIDSEQQKVEWCDLMIWQFPLWWFSLPGILKGWVDRVFAMGRFYGKDKLYEQGVFAGKKALLSLTTGGDAGAYEKGGFNGDMYNMLKPVHRGIFGFTGFTVLDPHVVYGPARLAPAEQEAALTQWSRRLQSIFEETPLKVGTY